jgi:hypothetical protein
MVNWLFEQDDAAAAPMASATAPTESSGSRWLFEQPPIPLQEPAIEAVKQNPDQAAVQQKLAQTFGMTPAEVKENQPDLEAQLKAAQISEQTSKSPTLNSWMAGPWNAAIASDDVPILADIERLSRSWKAGVGEVRMGRLGTQWRSAPDDPVVQEKITDLQRQLQEIGDDTQGGFVGYIAPAFKVLAQQAEMLSDPAAQARVGAAGAAGAVLGTTVLPGAGTAGGAIVGLGSGILGNNAWESYVIEGGGAYIEMRKSGVEADTASVLSHGVGIINAALETASATVIGKPFAEGAKAAVGASMKQVLTNPTVMSAAKTFVAEYGAGVLAEASTEVMQEIVTITANEIGKELTDPNLPSISQEELTQRLTDTFLTTLQAMSVLAAPGPAFHISTQIAAAKRAEQNGEVLDALHENMVQSKLKAREPEAFNELVSQIVQNSDVDKDTFVAGAPMMDFIMSQPDPAAFATQLGVGQAQMDSATNLGTDIRLDTDKFMQHVLSNENYPSLADFVRQGEDGFTRAELKEFEATGMKDSVAETINAVRMGVQGNEPIDIATQETGLQGFFMSAEEAGMTPEEYKDYLLSVQKAADRSGQVQKEKVLKQQRRELDASWKAELETEREIARASLANEPVYAALNGVAAERLDMEQVETRLKANDMTLDDLPTQAKGRRLYQKGGLDVDTYAELYGFDDGETLVLALAHAKPFEQTVNERANNAMMEKHGDIRERIQAIDEAVASLHNDDYAAVLEAELNSLRNSSYRQKGDTAPKRVSASLLRKAAKQELNKFTVSEISANRFYQAEKRYGKAAKKALREGNRKDAAQYKFQQLLNFEMFRLADKAQAQITRQKSYLQNFQRNRKSHASMKPEYLKAIREVLANVKFAGRPGNAALNSIANSNAHPVEIDSIYKEASPSTNYRDMTLSEFKSMYDQVKTIEHTGKNENKFRKAGEKLSVDLTAKGVVETIDANVKDADRNFQIGQWAKMKGHANSIKAAMFNMDTILREMDGFKDFGAVYTATKARIDKAMGQGYNEGQVGYFRRSNNAAKDLTAIFNRHFTLSDKKKLDTAIKIDGMDRKVTHNIMLSVLLNSGNQENINALVDTGTLTGKELQAIWDHASAKDIAFVNDVHAYLESFWPEIVSAVERRTNTTPNKVETQRLSLKNGTIEGGYFPLRYDTNETILTANKTADDFMQQTRYGSFATSHTADGHTKARKDRPDGAKVLLDPVVLNSHIDQVIFDLEMGDAVNDFYKVWFHPEVKKSFAEKGLKHYWDYGDVWLRDTITQELGATKGWESAVRHARTGFTVGALAWNLGTIMSQSAGLIQSSIPIGRKHMYRGIRSFLEAPWFDKNSSIFAFQAEKSGLMASLQTEWQKDMHREAALFSSTFSERHTPGRSAEYVKASFFWGITKMQGVVNAITWQAAYSKGIEQFNGDEKQAVAFADRQVVRTQGSGIFHERTGMERGSLTKDKRQQEMLRAFTPLISYFTAKFNITYERTKQTSFRNPAQVTAWAWDMALLYVVEGAIAALMSGKGPQDDEDKGWWLMKQTANTMFAGIPLVREFAGAARGFPGGGVIGSISDTFGKAWEAGARSFKKEELNTTLIKSANTLAGIMFHYPSSQINKFISAKEREEKTGEGNIADYLFGPPPKKRN